jgi:lipopolysaccharide/colanic/teichoic acid biosynthesis glycosyltransferase
VPHWIQRVIAGLALALASPVIAMLLVGAWISTRRSPVFRQVRVGLNGQEFFLHKIRTVAVDGPPVWPSEGTPARTRFGRFLRRYWLDEILQLWDVVRSKMNLVGPRPEMVQYANYFRKILPSYSERLCVRPGITGLAQISGYRNDTDLTERLRLDLAYIAKRTSSFDAYILLRTAQEIVTARAYRNVAHDERFAERVTRAVLGSPDDGAVEPT